MTEIKIKVDFDRKEVHGIECEYEDKFEIAKVLLNVANGIFSRITLKQPSRIIKPKIKILGGGNGRPKQNDI